MNNIKKVLSTLSKSVDKDVLKEAEVFGIKNVKFEFRKASYRSFKNKAKIVSEFNKIKNKLGVISDLKVINDVDNRNSYCIEGICTIPDVLSLFNSVKSFETFIYRPEVVISFDDIFDIILKNKKLYQFIKLKEEELKKAQKLKSKEAGKAMLAKKADFINKIPNVDIYVYETGDSRGATFSEGKKIKARDLFSLLFSSGSQDDFAESRIGQLILTLFNSDEEDWQNEISKVILKVIKTKKDFIDTWEEGTTGIGLDKDKLVKAVKLADYDALNGSEDFF